MTTIKCHNDDLHNCKYCRFAGRVCDGPPGYARELVTEKHVHAGGYTGAPARWELTYSDGTVEAVGQPRYAGRCEFYVCDGHE